MDSSKEYILMCEKAIEIQELWKCDTGDFNYSPGHDIVFIADIRTRWRSRKQKNVWLPRQDQLQDIIPGLPLNHVLRISKFVDNLDDGSGTILKWDSMEQLWLALIMYNKFSKRWNGKDWTNES